MKIKRLTPAERAEIRDRYAAAKQQGSVQGFVTQIAKEYGISKRTISKVVNNFNFQTDKTFTTEDGQFITGTSVLTGADGKEIMRWTKSKADLTPQLARAMVDGLKHEIRQTAPTPGPEKLTDDYLAAYIFGDPHFGMYSWKPETGNDFDLEIAERDFKRAIDRLIASAPACEQGLFVNLGDLFHSDFLDNKTWRSGHVLDTDGRWSKVVQVVVRTIRYCIEQLLAKHQKVTVISAIGNHDDHSSLFLMVLLKHVYENEPRVDILDDPTVKHYFRFGRNLIGVHHGHSIKMAELPGQMARDRPKDWGECEGNWYWWTGHIHHDSKKEYNGVIVESFRTLAGRDAYAASHGYNSGRDAKCILLHKEYGEVERHTVNVEMIKNNE